MAWLQGLTKRNIPPGTNDPPFIPIGCVWHVRAGRGASLYDYFNGPSGGIEAHGYVRYDGTGEQYRDTDISTDAQAAGNWWVGADGQRYGYLAWETEGVCGELWTPEQLNTMVNISRQVHRLHGIPYRKCAGPKLAGHGYHSLFTEWNPHLHACPCKERVAQFPAFLTQMTPPPVITTPAPKPVNLQGSGSMLFLLETGEVYVTGGDRNAEGKTRLYGRLAGGPPAQDGNFHDYLDGGTPAVHIKEATLRKRGYVFPDDPNY